MSGLDQIRTSRKTGEEPLQGSKLSSPILLIDFWRWANSDLVNNLTRGVLAEFIVGTALYAASDVRKEWMPYDLETASGISVEVKCAAYLQTWKQTRLSQIKFDVKHRKAWDPATNEYSDQLKRHAAVYVFCLLAEKDKRKLDPLNLDQWEFYVISTTALNERLGDQGSLALSTLKKLDPILAKYSGLAHAVETVFKINHAC